MNELINQLKQYAELRIDLFRLSTAEITIKAASSSFTNLILGVLLMSTLLMAELALGLYLGKYFGDLSTGFICITGCNFLIFIFALLLKKSLTHSIQDGLSKFFK